LNRRELIKETLLKGTGVAMALNSLRSRGDEKQTEDSSSDEKSLGDVTTWATIAGFEFNYYPDHERNPSAGTGIVYKRVNGLDLELNVVTAGTDVAPRSTLIYFHGGGWVHLKKEDRILYLLPYLARGMNTVNVEYRVANQALAPAAVEDCRCALRWVFKHADEYGFDTARIVVAGESAGGHLALLAAMLGPDDGFDKSCAFSLGQSPIGVSAVVNFFGIVDVLEVLQGPKAMDWAVEWFGDLSGREELARKVSPINYVRKGLPPIITVHGTKDSAVPYPQAVRLHQALDASAVPNKLVTIHGGHGFRQFSRAQNLHSMAQVLAFLEDHGINRR
jgi:acetyl esterase/lipase